MPKVRPRKPCGYWHHKKEAKLHYNKITAASDKKGTNR